LPRFKFIGVDARFYPQERDSQGQSLMATHGTVVDFGDVPPSDGLWIPAGDEEAPQEPVPVKQEAPQEPAPVPVAEPELPAPVIPTGQPEPAPVPEVPVLEPEPPAPVTAPPVPEPQPEPATPEQPFMRRYVSPYART